MSRLTSEPRPSGWDGRASWGAGESSGWDWFDEQLTHPAGRATTGEPSLVCGRPVPGGAHWKHRDRHVCSARCNTTVRRLNRASGELSPRFTRHRT